MSRTIKRGDTKPDLVIGLTDNGLAVDLSTAVAVRVIAQRGGATLFIDTAPTLAALTGVVTHLWTATQTAAVGRIFIEVEVTWGDNSVQTFPDRGYLTVDVVPDLG